MTGSLNMEIDFLFLVQRAISDGQVSIYCLLSNQIQNIISRSIILTIFYYIVKSAKNEITNKINISVLQ